MTTARGSWIGAYALICRPEYLRGVSPAIFIPFFLCGRTWSDGLRTPALESMLVVLLMFATGNGINAIADRNADAISASKRRIADAVARLGVPLARTLMLLHVLAAIALLGHMSWQLHSRIPLRLGAIAFFWGWGYSSPPLRFKVRGTFWHAVALIVSCGLAPLGLLAYAYAGIPTWATATFFLGFAIAHYGFELASQAVDFLADRAAGLRTPAVRMGLTRCLAAALIVPVAGLVLEGAGLYGRMMERGLAQPARGWSAAGLPLFAAMVALLLLGRAVPLRGIWNMYRLSRREPAEICMPRLQQICRYARWQKISLLGAALATGLMFAAANAAHP